MLALGEAETPGFEEILEEAKETLQQVYPGWTNYNPADSGMLLLELFAFMTEAQRFHLEQLGKSHDMAFLNLLGVRPQTMKPARTYVRAEGVTEEEFVPRGFKLSADTLVFEAETEAHLLPEHIWEHGEQMPFYPFGEHGRKAFEIRLRGGLDLHTPHTLYFDVYDGYPVSRNLIVPEEFIPLVRLRIEWSDGAEWRPCEIYRDSTYGLLQTGMVTFGLGAEEGEWDGRGKRESVLRLTAVGEYDTAPLVNDFSFNVIPFVQRDTRIECREYPVSDCENSEFVEFCGDSWLAGEGDTEVYIRTGRGYQRTEAFSSYVSGGRRYFVLSGEDLAGSHASAVCLVSHNPGLPADLFDFEGNGLPGQKFFLPDHRVLGDTFRLWVEESPGCFEPWTVVPDFAGAGERERCYVLDENGGILRFGNGRQGVMPTGCIKIISYAVCAGSGGNIQSGQVSGTGAVRYSNPSPARGGREPETVDQCLKRCREEDVGLARAVTAADYEEVIRRTPGLRIRKVRVFPSAERENGLDAVVQPYTSNRQTIRGGAYEENILLMLEKKKLLGTSVRLKKPEYIRVSLQLEIAVKSRYSGAEERIRERIRDYFEEQMDFGKTIVYSKVFGYIDALPETERLCVLEIHAGGSGVVIGDNRDIRIPIYGMPYLGEIELQRRSSAYGEQSLFI